MLGPDQPVILKLFAIPDALEKLKGTVMEVDDCAFPLVTETIASADPMEAFDGTDYALLVGARPRGPGMERKDLLEAKAKIFSVQGKELSEKASRDVKVTVVGTPGTDARRVGQEGYRQLETQLWEYQ